MASKKSPLGESEDFVYVYVFVFFGCPRYWAWPYHAIFIL